MKLLHHSRQRMDEMGVDLDEVMAVVRDPEIIRPDLAYRDRERLTAGRLTVIIRRKPAPKSDRIVTVMWREDFVRPEHEVTTDD